MELWTDLTHAKAHGYESIHLLTYVSSDIWEVVGDSRNLQRNGKYYTRLLKGLCNSRPQAEGQIRYPTEPKMSLDVIFRQPNKDFFQEKIQLPDNRCLIYQV